MALLFGPHSWSPRLRRAPADDAYTAWFNANSRCATALRAWREASPAARAQAHRHYLEALALEEAAAAELGRLHARPLAA
jgi:hypothetical protein